MSLFWALQFGLNVLLVAGFVWWQFDRRRYLRSKEQDKVRAMLNVIESRAIQQEKQWNKFRAQMQDGACQRLSDLDFTHPGARRSPDQHSLFHQESVMPKLGLFDIHFPSVKSGNSMG